MKETLSSLTQQSNIGWSCVVLDDSIDPVEGQAVAKCVYEFQDARIRYQKNPQNLGLAKNWNQALELGSSYELMVILHGDDRLKPDYIDEMVSLAARRPEATGYFCKSEIIGSDGRPVFSMADFYKKLLLPKQNEIILTGLDGIKKLIPGNFIFCPSLCYRPKMLGQARFRTDLKMVVDFDFILRILRTGGSWVGYYDHSLFEYRRHSQNTTAMLTQNLSRFHEEIELYQDLSAALYLKNEFRLSKAAGEMRVVKLNLLFQIFKSFISLNLKAFFQEIHLFLRVLGNTSKHNEKS